ncbi:importin-13 [Epargyreus clarus]|uniref:importin-13 n=1 Tax=Epargyreus clarus TaxID=520877 RepID=UPI003C2F084A
MEYTVQNLEYAVSVFYNGEQAERANAHSWLTEAQRVPEAWNFVWELLQPSKNTEVQFYAATTLHTKILRCWNEVPPESYEELKQKLLQAVVNYSMGPKIVTNRLCISLAAFILQQGSEDLAAVLSPLSTAENTSLLLEVLTVIPEEYNSMTMGTILRRKNRAALQQASTMVLDDMLRYLQTVYNDYSKEPPSDEVVQAWLAAATCAGSWLALGGEEGADTPSTLAERTPLCRALFTVVHVLYTWNECVCGLALEACEACLNAVRAAGVVGDAARHEHTAALLLADLAALADPLLAAHNVPNSINEELLSAVITCCVAVTECHARVLVAGVQAEPADAAARRLLRLLLAAQAAPGHYPLHETRSNLVFGLWYTLQDEILHMRRGDEKVHPVWKEVFTQLLLTLITKAEAPTEQTLSRDDEEQLRCYRQDIGDTVLYCHGILGVACWQVVEGALSGARGEARGEARREAALHVFQALADTPPADAAPAALLRALHHAVHVANTAHNKRMLTTALDCLGSYAAWVGSLQTEEGEELASACVRAAGGALARAPAAAALALRKLCDDCPAAAAELAEDIVRAAQSPEGRSDAWVRRQLISAAGAALAAGAPASAAPAALHLAQTLHDELAAHVEVVCDKGAQPAAASRAAVEADRAAKCVAALLSPLGARPALAAQLLRALLPALAPMPHHAALADPMFQILKQAVSALMVDCLPMVNEIAQLTVSGFETLPCPVGLDVVKYLLVYGGAAWAGGAGLARACVARTARRVAAEPAARPDLVDALYSLLATVAKKKAAHHAMEALDDLFPELIDLACTCMKLPEPQASRAACGWLAALAAARADALQPHARDIVDALLRCIGGLTPRNHIEPLAVLLLALNKAAWRGAELGAWLRPALAAAAAPAPHHRDAFLAAVLREKNSKRRMLEIVQEFSLACRGLIGTEYARQTMASKQLVA